MAAVRVLMLHGYTQNAAIFSKKLGAIRKAAKNVEMVFIDAPHVVNMPTSDASAFDSTADEQSSDPELIPRAWWFANEAEDGTKSYRGAEESFQLLAKVLQEQKFDGVFGFSQGAAMAAMLTSVLHTPSLHPAFAQISPPIDPFSFSVLVAGFKSIDPSHTGFFPSSGLDIRTCHVLGRGDTIVGEDRTKPLVDAFKNPQVVYHDGGHHVPSQARFRTFFREYFETRGQTIEGSSSQDRPSLSGRL